MAMPPIGYDWQPDKAEAINSNDRSNTVSEVIDGRESVYGEPVDGMIRIAQIWNGILGHECKIDAADVPLMLIGMKLVRAHAAPDYADNSDDIEGYLDIFRQVVGKDMIHARNVSDYLMKKHDL